MKLHKTIIKVEKYTRLSVRYSYIANNTENRVKKLLFRQLSIMLNSLAIKKFNNILEYN